MKLGYACINTSMKRKFRTCRVATAEKEGEAKLKELTLENLKLTRDIIRWNIDHGIYFYRMSSDLVVLATHPVNLWDWKKDEDVMDVCAEIKDLKERHGVRLSMHPGQYSVLNSPKEEVVANTIADLQYHADLMDLTGGSDMILHLGGKYGDKEKALDRLVSRTEQLPLSIFEKLRYENDDRTYNLEDAVKISERTKVPVCFDIHHHFCHPADCSLHELLPNVWQSWESVGRPKVHISSGREFPTDRRHNDYVKKEDFERLLFYLDGQAADVMLEAKQKEQAVLKLREELSSDVIDSFSKSE